jgi:hypothetical protein
MRGNELTDCYRELSISESELFYDHTLFIYSTEQPLSDALVKLGKLVKDNVYV